MLTPSDLRPYQNRAIEHIISGNSSMLWLDVGLGKSIVSLTAIERMLDSYQVTAVLVVGPIKVIETVWEQEALSWSHTRRLNFSMIRGTPKERERALVTQADVYLINYEMLPWLTEKLQRGWILRGQPLPFDMVVFDEISKMKNSTSQRCKAFCKILPYFTHRVGLTGTPATNGLIDLHGQFLVVDGGFRLGPNITGYRNRWFEQNPYSMKWMPRINADKEIQGRIQDITVEMSAEDYLTLPPLTTIDHQVEMPEESVEMYQEFEEEFYLELDEVEVEAFNAGSLSMKLRQLANGAVYSTPENKEYQTFHDAKMEALVDLVDELQGQPLLICYQFNHDKDRILKQFPDAMAFSSKNTKEAVAAWNSRSVPILLGHPLSMGHGLNLQHGGNNICWFGLPWSLEQYEQAIGRLLRSGQKGEAVLNHRLITKGTIEESIAEVVKQKGVTQKDLREAVKQRRL